MKEKELWESLTDYGQSDMLPMHMPGHKRKETAYLRALSVLQDITEIPGFDQLHQARGILRQSMETAAKVFGAAYSRYLVNGSTGGILAGMYALYQPDTAILLARNCHMSAYHGAELLRAKVEYIQPQFDSKLGIFTAISPDAVRDAIQKSDTPSLLVLPSPTYEGIVSDLDAICDLAHRNHIAVLVDAAHGAHFGFHPAFPANPVASGADIVVRSLHKTLPSLTGTAIAHIADKATLRDFDHALEIFETSSPSYLFLSSIDGCIHYLSKKGKTDIDQWAQELTLLRAEAQKLKNLVVYEKYSFPGAYDFDVSKLLLGTKKQLGLGAFLYNCLRKDFHIEPEMHSLQTVLLMSSPMDTREDYQRLLNALFAMDTMPIFEKPPVTPPPVPIAQPCMSAWEATHRETVQIPIPLAKGKICGEYIYAYPPGSPVCAPGERITGQCADYFTYAKHSGIALQHSRAEQENKIVVLKETVDF